MNPVAYVKALGGKGQFMGVSSYRMWQLASRVFHREGLSEARKYLETSFQKHLKDTPSNRILLKRLASDLQAYSQDFQRLRSTIVDLARRLEFQLTPNVTIRGEIPRIDLVTAGGYGVYLFLKKQSEWKNELRMPLIQYYYAAKLGSPIEEVVVGVYCLETAKHECINYTSKEIANAQKEAQALAKILDREYGRK